MIKTWEHRYIPETLELWNREAVKDGYKEYSEETFSELILENKYFDPESVFLLFDEDERLMGFAIGCTGADLPLGAEAGYITCMVSEGKEAEGDSFEENFTLLLEALETRFRLLGKTQADVLFFNPMMLPWYIPDTPGHEHNNAPGVPVGCRMHEFLLRSGYVERAIECGMYLRLDDFAIPETITLKARKAEAEGYRVGVYDPSVHKGMEEMLDSLGNPLWRKQIPEYAADGAPLIIVENSGILAGFAGPVIRQANGRAFFAGIGVHPHHEGHGLGTVLFFNMCEAFRLVSAEYISLFTGSENPAKSIYEKAGFRTVKSFAVMRREL
ncbi:GNAT family N-acetyltransferase [Paenibacillus vini]|uniref:GNAT family N-acetyltransferase n=1 Tax=Paenibacillus vini TaxID=1476024 RepID=UPI0025B6BFD9|nr:GNAT family N-acetyltransferase [Paenibacillus vini]MDN4069088.1 GNAT family N-acetyltransferase [Paenibacillus vini]